VKSAVIYCYSNSSIAPLPVYTIGTSLKNVGVGEDLGEQGEELEDSDLLASCCSSEAASGVEGLACLSTTNLSFMPNLHSGMPLK